MTKLSVNLNKIALLRNSRGRNYPDPVYFAHKVIALGADGITVHPRQDERHITRQDARDLAKTVKAYPEIELNIEGYPSREFLDLIKELRPHQCTLVPDGPDQLTSDHGWDLKVQSEKLIPIIEALKSWNVRSAIFLDPDLEQVQLARASKTERIELYTEKYASMYGTVEQQTVFQQYADAAKHATELGLGVNAGHDLDLQNLATFLQIPDILEVSIGHALTVESIEYGIEDVVRQYLSITHSKP